MENTRSHPSSRIMNELCQIYVILLKIQQCIQIESWVMKTEEQLEFVCDVGGCCIDTDLTAWHILTSSQCILWDHMHTFQTLSEYSIISQIYFWSHDTILRSEKCVIRSRDLR